MEEDFPPGPDGVIPLTSSRKKNQDLTLDLAQVSFYVFFILYPQWLETIFSFQFLASNG